MDPRSWDTRHKERRWDCLGETRNMMLDSENGTSKWWRTNPRRAVVDRPATRKGKTDRRRVDMKQGKIIEIITA